LHSSADGGKGATIELLISKGAGLDCKDHAGRTAAHYAAAKPENVDVLQQLKELGADMSIPDVAGITPLAIVENSQDEKDKVLNRLVEARDKAEQHLSFMEERRARFEMTTLELESLKQEAIDRAAETDKKTKALEAEVDHMQKLLGDKDGDLATANRKLQAQVEAMTAAAEEESQRVAKELEEMKEKMATLQKAADDHAAQASDANAKFSNTRKELSDTQGALEKAQSDLGQVQAELKAATEKKSSVCNIL